MGKVSEEAVVCGWICSHSSNFTWENAWGCSFRRGAEGRNPDAWIVAPPGVKEINLEVLKEGGLKALKVCLRC